MTTTANDLMQAILLDPESDDRRLVYADWLEEQGEAERSLFIRVQCELNRMARWSEKQFLVLPESREGQYIEALRRRERELLTAGNAADWSGLPYQDYGKIYDGRAGEFLFRIGGSQIIAEFHRGFVDEVRCTLADLMQHGPAIVSQQPVTKVVATDREPQRFPITTPYIYGWYRGVRVFDGHERDEPLAVPNFIWEMTKSDPHGNIHGNWLDFASRQAAIDALSTALVRWARGKARLEIKE